MQGVICLMANRFELGTISTSALDGQESPLHQRGANRETAMANDSDWVDDVRRWCLSQPRPAVASTSAPSARVEDDELGYEAANPPVQAAHWPDTPAFGAQAPSP